MTSVDSSTSTEAPSFFPILTCFVTHASKVETGNFSTVFFAVETDPRDPDFLLLVDRDVFLLVALVGFFKIQTFTCVLAAWRYVL